MLYTAGPVNIVCWAKYSLGGLMSFQAIWMKVGRGRGKW